MRHRSTLVVRSGLWITLQSHHGEALSDLIDGIAILRGSFAILQGVEQPAMFLGYLRFFNACYLAVGTGADVRL